MSFDNIWQWSETAASNTAIASIDITGTTGKVKDGDNAIRAVMAQVITTEGKGTAIASAATLTLSGPERYFHITGSTGPITDIDFTDAVDGRWAWLIFDSTPTITHNATTLILPGATSITAAAGDRALFIQDATDNVICLEYVRASGNPTMPDTNATHRLILAAGSNLTADRTLTITSGDAAHTLDISGAPTNVVLATGSYTPTLFNGANVAASTAQVCRYSRVGDTVTVSGYFNVDATTTATLTTIGMSFPFASNLALIGDVGGVASSGTSESWQIFADVAGDVATFTTLVNTAAAHDVMFVFQYVIK
jgi:hypothetical protein